MTDVYDQLAKEIVTVYLQEEVESVTPIVGKGFVNQIRVVGIQHSKVVVRMNADDRALDDYLKERWCIRQAADKGIIGPTVLTVGEHGGVAYMIQTFVEGDNGEDCPSQMKHIWRELGRFARRIHSIPASGYGDQLSDPIRGLFQSPRHDGFDGTWKSYVRYNINCLTDDDELIRLDVLRKEESREVRGIFEGLLRQDFVFGLIHGDLSLKNALIRGNGEVALLDWGSAGVSIVPHFEMIHLLHCQLDANLPNDADVAAFLEGYGISPGEYQSMQMELHALWLLKAFDTLRWAIDRRPDLISQYADYAGKIKRRVLTGS